MARPRALAAPFVLAACLLGALPEAGAQAKAGRVVRVGYLHLLPIMAELSPERRAFIDQLQALGYEVGRNLILEYRSAVMRPELLADLAQELVAAKMDVIVTVGMEASQAAKDSVKTVPIVMVPVEDPVGAGLVASLARPSGNVTGFTTFAPELAAKRLQLLREALPTATRVAVLWNGVNRSSRIEWQNAQAAARGLGFTLTSLEFQSVQDLPAALARLARDRHDALYVIADPLASATRFIIVETANERRVPTIGSWPEFADAGSLMTYAAPFAPLFRRAAVYVDRIVRGARPADLPVERATTFELIVNHKTARALGLTLPPSLLLRADRIIE